jgi:predicted Zn-ribbon and HTH transcriptional regulator
VKKTNKTAEPPPRRISFIYLVIIFIIFVLAITALLTGVGAYYKNPQDATALSFMLIGFIGLALSMYMLLQTQRKPSRVAFEMPRVITTILCQKCGFKNIRDFQRGDYIFKEAEPCPKCKEKTMIASIYREVKEKGKES